MIEPLNTHFSFTSPASIHDEEALTGIELAGRQGAKINEIVKDQNNLRTEMETFKSEDVPEQIENEVKRYIYNGSFNDAIENEYNNITKEIGNEINVLKSRVNNLTELPDGSTSGDAELLDGRVEFNGLTNTNIGNAIRNQTNTVYTSLQKLKDNLFRLSDRNFVEPLFINMVEPSEHLTVLLKDNGNILLNGYTDKNCSFDLYIDPSNLPIDMSNLYARWNKNILTGNTGTWGFSFHFNDGTKQGTWYSSTNYFQILPSSVAGKRLVKITITFSAGFTFDNEEVSFFTDIYNGGFLGYEPRYLEKTENTTTLNGKKWVSVGDSLTQNSGNTGINWQSQVANETGLNPVICAMGGRTTSGFLMDDVYGKIPLGGDIISVMGGTNDASQNVPLGDDTNTNYFNTGTYKGSIRTLIKKLQTDFPNADIIFCTCLAGRKNKDGSVGDTPFRNSLGLTHLDYAKACVDACQSMGVPCIDLCGESGINTFNCSSYYVDNVHPNKKGYEKIAKIYINNFKRLYL